jgi:hypothetical protein
LLSSWVSAFTLRAAAASIAFCNIFLAVYEWDLGPNVRADLSHDQGNVGSTYEEKQAAIFG